MTVDVVTLGESVGLITPIENLPIVRRPLLRIGFGGAESNVAIGLARLGRTVHWVGRLGTDDIGRLIARELRAERVRTTIIEDPAPTGLMIKAHSAAGQVQVTYYRTGSAGSRLRPDDIDEELIGSARVLHVTGITPALGDGAEEAVRAAVEIARERGVLVSLDVNYRSALWSTDQATPVLRDLLKAADVCFATEAEAELLVTERGPEAQASALGALGPAQVVLKRGADGCVASIDGSVLHQAPVAVTAVDPVGAGDAFAAGYLSQLVAGEPPTRRLSVGALAGALAVTSPGDWEGLPYAADLTTPRLTDDVLR